MIVMTHHSHHRRTHTHATRTTSYKERIIAFPFKTGVPYLFSIAKKVSKHSGVFEGMLSVMQEQRVVKTDNPDFDDKYTLLVSNESNLNDSNCVNIALRVLPYLDQHLLTVDKILVGQTTYTCIISFLDDICFVRFNSHVRDITPFYNLASALMNM